MNVYDIFGSSRRAAVTESKIEVVHEYVNEDFSGLMFGANNEDIAGPGGSDNNDSTSPIHGFGENYDDIPDLENVGEQVVSIMDAERRLAQGDRIFAFHEMDEEPSEIHDVGQLAGYDAEQLLAVPQGVAEGLDKETLRQELIKINQQMTLNHPRYNNPNSPGHTDRYFELMKKRDAIIAQLKQGVAEAGDPNFLKFMNTSLGDRVDSPASAQKTGNAQYDNAPVTDLDSGNVGYRAALDFCTKTLQKLTPTQKTKLATRGEDGVTEWLAKQAAKTGFLPNQFVEEDIVEVQDYLSDVFRDPAITSWALVLTDGEPLPKRPSKAPYTIQMNKGYGPGTDEHGNKHGVQIRGRDWVTVDVLDNAHEAAEMFKGLVAKNPNYYYHMIDGTGRYVASHNVYKKSVTEGSLEELANTSLKVKEPKNSVNINDRKQVTYKVMKFKSGKDTYLINFTVKSAPAFGKKQNWNAVNVAFGVREEQDEYSFGDEINTDLTARNKNQFLIYSTVINAIRKFITEYNTEIDEIIMQGAGERQEAMYQRFFQSAGKYFPGWHFNGKHSLVRDIPRKPVKKVRESGVAEAHDRAAKEIHGNLFHNSIPPGAEKHHVSAVLKAHGLQDTDAKDVIDRVRKMGYAGNRLGKPEIPKQVAEGRVLHRDLKSWTDDAKSQGLNVIKPKNDLEWTHHATDKTGKVCGKFCTTNVPQNSRGFIHKQGLAEMEDDGTRDREVAGPDSQATNKQFTKTAQDLLNKTYADQTSAMAQKAIVQKKVHESRGDYKPPKEADYGDDYQAMVKRVAAQEKRKQQQPQPQKKVSEDEHITSPASRELVRVARQSNPEATSDADAINAYMGTIAKKTQDNYKKVNDILRQLDPLSNELQDTERELHDVENVNKQQQDLLRKLSQRVDQVKTNTLPSQVRATNTPAQYKKAQDQRERDAIQLKVGQDAAPHVPVTAVDTGARNELERLKGHVYSRDVKADIAKGMANQNISNPAGHDIKFNPNDMPGAAKVSDIVNRRLSKIRQPQQEVAEEDVYESRLSAMKRAGYDIL